MTIDEIVIGDAPEAWEEIGFVVSGGICRVGSVALRFVGADGGRGILEWSLRELETGDLDGLPARASTSSDPDPPRTQVEHPNGALRLDHVVVTTDDLGRTVAALEGAGMSLRRIRDEGPRRMAFFRLGEVILELVEGGEGPPRLWGLVAVVEDIDRLAGMLGSRLGGVHDAVQPGRRIASLEPGSGVSPAVAFISP